MPEQSSGCFLNQIFPGAQLLMEMSGRKVGITTNCSLMEGSKKWPPHFPGEKLVENTWKNQASKVPLEFPWLHKVPQSWEKHAMEDTKMTRFCSGLTDAVTRRTLRSI